MPIRFLMTIIISHILNAYLHKSQGVGAPANAKKNSHLSSMLKVTLKRKKKGESWHLSKMDWNCPLFAQVLCNKVETKPEQIEKYFKCAKSHQKFIFQSQYWNSFQNTWIIEAKMCNEGLGIQANKKVGILRTPDKSTRFANFEAILFCF